MDDITKKLRFCRDSLCDAQLDLIDFVADSGYIEPVDDKLLLIYNVIRSLIDSIDAFL